jgi:hypothetical protein
MMLLSIVTGTYNRLPHLQRMMASVREGWPRHLPLEFVIVDGGSTDGTLAWLETQPDVRLINHGELRGAIRAFCEGAEAARGDYVVMANDDVAFWSDSLLRAIVHLETHRACGAVAFADNRSEQKGVAHGFRAEKMPAIASDGKPTAVVYAQVGMFRRWLGDRVGWWGMHDEFMGSARTYGGDNFLSACIWELGYGVEAVEGCAVNDQIVQDLMRRHNASGGARDGQQYYGRFPRGPRLQPYPQVPNPQHERLRILALPIYEPRLPGPMNKEYGLSEAFAAIGLTWEIDYVNEDADLVEAVRLWQPHVLFVQLHDTDRIDAAQLRAARTQRPDMTIINWNGDAHERGLTTPNIVETLREVDLQTVVNAKVLPIYEELDIPAAYWQIAYKDPVAPYPGKVPAHEVLFLGNCYNDRRHQLVGALRQTGLDVGIYGSCPGAVGNTHYDFAMSRALYETCVIAVSDTFPDTVGYVSNRLFQALSAGAFVLQEHSPRLEEFNGLVAGEHYIEWGDLEDLRAKIAEWVKPERMLERDKIAAQGCAYVREHFSYDAQVRKLWGLLPV